MQPMLNAKLTSQHFLSIFPTCAPLLDPLSRCPVAGMFDRENRGQVSFQDFGALWKYVTDWQNCFRSFDTDNSGNIDRDELRNALQAFGYRLSDNLVNVLLRKFDRHGNGTILFDDFIQCCVILYVSDSGGCWMFGGMGKPNNVDYWSISFFSVCVFDSVCSRRWNNFVCVYFCVRQRSMFFCCLQML